MKVLFIGAHPDDIELGCGATIAKRFKEWDVFCATLCNCAIDGKRPDLPECQVKSLNSLGVYNDVFFGDFKPTLLPSSRNEVWKFINDLKEKIKPDVVYVNSPDDQQDHVVVFNESVRNFYETSLITYQIPRSESFFDHNYYEIVSKENVQSKIESLKCYPMYSFDKYEAGTKACFDEKFTESQLRTNGVYIGSEFAEVFRIVKVIH